MSSFWRNSESHNVPLHRLLSTCAKKITEWNKSSFGSVQSRLKNLRSELDDIKLKERTSLTVVEVS